VFETLLEIRDAIARNKMRTIATGIAVASGLFLLIVLLGASNGIIHTMEQNASGLALDVVEIWPGYTSKPYNGLEEGRPIHLYTDDETATQQRFPHFVRSTSTSVEQSGLYATAGKNRVACTLMGVSADYAEMNGRKILQGRFINSIDIREQRRVCVIDRQRADLLFPHPAQAIGSSLQVNGSSWMVVGVLDDDDHNSTPQLLAPASTVRTIYAKGHDIEGLSLRTRNLDSPATAEQFEQDLTTLLAHRHGFSPSDRGAVWIWNMADESQSLQTANNVLHTSFWILGLLTLLSGIVGVSNIMLITVKERTHEFGIRKALGARPWNIIGMVILESVIITTFFGYVGMLCGIGFCEWMDHNVAGQTMDMGIFQQQYFIDPTVDLATCIQATIVMILAGALAGFFPAWRAARVKPIEALRGN